MKSFVFALLFVAVMPSAHAALSEYRTQVQVSSGGGTLPLTFGFDGGLNSTSAYVDINDPATNGAKALSELASGGFVPTLKVKSVAGNTRHQAVAWGVQGFTNTSGNPLDTSLIMHLTAEITGGNDLEARMYLFQDENFEFYPDSGTILFESSSQLWPDFSPFANNLGPTGFDISKKNFDGPVDEMRQFDFTIAPGDSLYVWSQLAATADNEGMVDAFSTLTATFSNTTGLAPVAAVPLPGSALLFLPALVSMVGFAGFRREI